MFFLSFLPVIGTVVEGISRYLSTKNQLKETKDKNDIEEIRLRLLAQRKDFRFQLQQDMILFPFALWAGLYIWDQTVVLQYPDLVWPVKPVNEYLFYALLAFLFGLPIRDKLAK